ncbi:MAG TPA: FlgD immunoglobulin-like domain containing protein [bacterium]|nr:FlgD immunoglobulin-like domain containing protein [bacterium]
MKKLIYATLILLLVLSANLLAAYNLQFEVVQNDMTNGGIFDVKVQISSSGETFKMGTSNLVFTYNAAAVSPLPLTITPNASFSGGSYAAMTLTEPSSGRLSVNIVLSSLNAGTLVGSAWMDVATIRFTIVDKTVNAALAWRITTPSACIVYKDDQITPVASGTLKPLDATLPVELSAFSAANINGVVRLSWTTQSEMNSLGFYINRREGNSSSFQRISGLIEGAGTSAAPRHYTFDDERLEIGRTYFYMLEQKDTNGQVSWHGPISVTVESVQLPEAFYVEQNYPNPFNPTTTIEYGLPEAAQVRIRIYNMRGELVRTLVDGMQQAGNLVRVWDGLDNNGSLVPSGVYFCRVQSGYEHKMIKMVFAK